jgi:hypothetical protein
VDVKVADAVEVEAVPDKDAVPVEMRVVVVMVVVVVTMAAVAGLGVTRHCDSRETEGGHGGQSESSALEHESVLWA